MWLRRKRYALKKSQTYPSVGNRLLKHESPRIYKKTGMRAKSKISFFALTIER